MVSAFSIGVNVNSAVPDDGPVRLAQPLSHADQISSSALIEAHPNSVGTLMSFRDIVLLTFWLAVVVAGDLYFGGTIAFLVGW